MSIEFFKQREEAILKNINVAKIAKVEMFDNIRKRANITPKGYPMIQNALVLTHITLERGDNVVVIFNDEALDGSSQARHRIDDAIVIGKVII